MALAFFDVPHTSVRVVLRDETRTKALDLSPVVLSQRSEVFAARYRPGSEWAQSDIVVRDVDVAERVLRACYQATTVDAIMREGGWGLIAPALEFMDMFQFEKRMIDATLMAACTEIDTHGVYKFLGIGEGELGVPLRQLWALRATRLGENHWFQRILSRVFKVVPETEDLPNDLRIDHLWYAIESSGDHLSKKHDALLSVAKDLREGDETTARIHLQHIVSRDSIITSDRNSEAVFKILSEIKGDELSGSLVLRARDALAVCLKGGFGPPSKRKRGEILPKKKNA